MEAETLMLAGILLLSLIVVTTGGQLLLRITTGALYANELQKSWFRAGHAHAGVLLVLALALLPYTDHFATENFFGSVARLGVPVAAILMPAGFFLSVIGKDPQKPSKLAWLIAVGATSLIAGLLAAGILAIQAGAGG
ncbi:hypothetical protein ACT3UD_04370 [Glutamicibacter sp. 287]|uniref:hypothetical protein n=1 Tax=unclassified Glutamicibacter TaxID=2627139 RepID=UPI000BB92D15|nr:hypothetical protein [Glutamicibacter sp. BW80]PCC27592.1 hypothetical protein CIK76_15490 [Glutamicibacter sp. BW80]